MKKMFGIIALLALVAGIGLAGTPFRQTVTVTGGTGTYTYPAAGIVKPYAEAFRIQAIIMPSAIGTTNTISFIDGTTTNTIIAQKIIAAGATAQAITNDWWKFAGEKVLITCSATNAFTAVIIGEEQ